MSKYFKVSTFLDISWFLRTLKYVIIKTNALTARAVMLAVKNCKISTVLSLLKNSQLLLLWHVNHWTEDQNYFLLLTCFEKLTLLFAYYATGPYSLSSKKNMFMAFGICPIILRYLRYLKQEKTKNPVRVLSGRTD